MKDLIANLRSAQRLLILAIFLVGVYIVCSYYGEDSVEHPAAASVHDSRFIIEILSDSNLVFLKDNKTGCEYIKAFGSGPSYTLLSGTC